MTITYWMVLHLILTKFGLFTKFELLFKIYGHYRYSFIFFQKVRDIRAIALVGVKFLSILPKKKKKNLLFLFYTPTFTKHSCQFIYSKHLFNKIFILLHFFIISFTLLSKTLSLTAPLSLSLRPNTTQNHQHLAIINDQSPPTINPPNHHQLDQPPSSTHPSPSKQPPKTKIQRNLKPAKSTQLIHMESVWHIDTQTHLGLGFLLNSVAHDTNPLLPKAQA